MLLRRAVEDPCEDRGRRQQAPLQHLLVRGRQRVHVFMRFVMTVWRLPKPSTGGSVRSGQCHAYANEVVVSRQRDGPSASTTETCIGLFGKAPPRENSVRI